VQINNISVEGLAGGATGSNLAYTAKWTNKSQIFTLDAGNNGAMRITATLCSGQYRGVEPCSPQTDLNVYNHHDYSSYEMTYQSDVANTLYLVGGGLSGRKPVMGIPSASAAATGNVSNTDNGLNWYLIDAGSTLFNGGTTSEANVHYYVIVNVSGSGSTQTVKALKNTTAGSGVSTLSDSSSRVIANLWYVNEIGINIPLIKQMRTTYCGYTTILQIMYGAGTAHNLTSSTSLWDQTMVVGDSNHAYGIGPGARMSQYQICNRLNGTTNFTDGSFDKLNYRYYRTSLQSVADFHSYEKTNTKDKFVSLIRSSLQTGWGAFFLTSTAGAPFKYSPGEGHYVCISGYDPISDSAVLMNCHYYDNVFGYYLTDSACLYNSIDTLFWAESINQ
ncbi:MAG: C39 family peptidase, partial [Clostridia bacterium]|nr:C39 family peptidase [Clostridia bacterium]